MNVTLAVSIEDLHRVPAETRVPMLNNRVDFLNPIAHVGEPRSESIPAVQFTCELLEAATIVDILRSWDAVGKQEPTRVYVRNNEVDAAWRKIPGYMQLTLMIGDEVVLNRTAFAVGEESTNAAREAAEAIPLQRTTQPIPSLTNKQRHRPRIVG